MNEPAAKSGPLAPTVGDAPYRLLIEEMDVGAATLSLDGTILYANRRLCELLKCGAEQIVGSSFERFASHADQGRLRSLLRDGRSRKCAGDVLALAADGSTVPLKLAFSRIAALPTPIVCIIATDMQELQLREEELQRAHDELARRLAELARINRDLLDSRAAALNMMEDAVQAQAALARSEDRYREMFMTDLRGAYVSTPDGRVLDCNPAFLAMFGLASLEDARNVSLEAFFTRPEQRRAMVTDLRRNRRMAYHDQEYRRADGKPLHALESAVGIFDECGELIEIRGYVVDVTAQKELENQFRHAQKMEAIGKLAGGIAHDFNNVLCAILGYAEMAIERAQSDAIMLSDLQEIRSAGDRAARLTQQLLAFSRKTMALPRELSLNEVVTSVEKMLGRLIGEDVRLVLRTDRALGVVRADPGLVEQVLMNLAVNARDAMPRGGVLTITTTNVTLDAEFVRQHVGSLPGEYVAVSIADTGHGMSAEIIDHIFEPFFTTKAAGKGTGLGLSTVYGIVKQSGGYITVDSTLGVGTTFTVYLPRIEAAVTVAAKTRAVKATSRGTETILVAEDETFVGDLIRKVLEPAGYRVLLARSAAEALLIAQNEPEPIALLLTDVIMVDLHGPELAEHVRRLRPGIKVLFVSGFVDHAAVNLSELRRDAGFLAKPFSSEALLSKVRERLDSTAPHDVSH